MATNTARAVPPEDLPEESDTGYWLKSARNKTASGGGRRLHAKRDCVALKSAKHARAATENEVDYYPVCRRCDPETDVDYGKEPDHRCPYCEELVTRLPIHLRECEERP